MQSVTNRTNFYILYYINQPTDGYGHVILPIILFITLFVFSGFVIYFIFLANKTLGEPFLAANFIFVIDVSLGSQGIGILSLQGDSNNNFFKLSISSIVRFPHSLATSILPPCNSLASRCSFLSNSLFLFINGRNVARMVNNSVY